MRPYLQIWLVAQSCLTFCNPMVCSLAGSSVFGILQARILEWVAVPFSRGSSWPKDWTWVSCIAGGFFTVWVTKEPQSTMSGVLLRGNSIWKHRHSVMWWQRQGVEWCSYKPEYAKDCRPLPEDRNKTGRNLSRVSEGA